MSLTQTSKNFKTGLKVFVVFAFVYYLAILLIIPKAKIFLRKIIPPKNPPNPVFGQLDNLNFVSLPISNKSPRYVLDTKNARLPEKLPTQMPVYKIHKGQFSYLAGTEAEENAAVLGYSKLELTSDLKSDILSWKSLISGGELTIKKSSGEITARTNLIGKNGEYRPGNINSESAVAYAKNLFTRINKFDKLYEKGTPSVILGYFSNGLMNDTVNTLQTEFAAVNMYRTIGEFKILGQNPKIGLLNVTLRNPTLSGSPYNYPFVNVHYHSIDIESNAKYPVLYVDEAWDEVKKNNGIIVSVVPKGKNYFEPYTPVNVETIFVTDIYLAYYEPEEHTPYLQPIFVFDGKYTTRGSSGGDITLYFPAITKEFVKTTGK